MNLYFQIPPRIFGVATETMARENIVVAICRPPVVNVAKPYK